MDINEDNRSSSGGRTYRPESRASSNSRLTPQSSNNSSTNLQYRSQIGLRDRERNQERTPSDRRDSPGALLLQERLREKKAALKNERRSNGDELEDDSTLRSSPMNSSIGRSGRDRDRIPSATGERPLSKKGMGVKDMEEVNLLRLTI